MNESSSQDRNVEEQVHAEQVRTLYKQSAPVLLANVLNALIVSWALWSHQQHLQLITWCGAMTAVVLARIWLRKRYWSDERTLDEEPTWAARFTLGSLCAGALWGYAGGWFMPASLPHQLLILFVIGGMAAGAAASISCFLPAYFAFLLPSLVPALVRLWTFGDSEHLAMVAMMVMFIAALSLVAHNVNRALTQAFRLRFENSELYLVVSRAQAALIAANKQLQHANEQLEARVQARTVELQASQAQLFEIVSESPDAIVVFDEAGTVLSLNPATERITGKPASTLVGKQFSAAEVLGPEDTKRVSEAFAALLRGEEQPAEEFRLLRPGGDTVDVEMRMRVVSAPEGSRRIHSVIRDVSERHRLQHLREAYERRVREAERLESASVLAGGVAHDFNNVLTMILANVDLVERWVDSPEVKQPLGEIRHGSLQAANLTKQLLAFSRQQFLDVQATDLTRIVENARGVFVRTLGEQNQLTIALPAEPTVVLIDATQIEQAILNLLVNARHAVPHGGGRVALEVRRVELDGDPDWPDVERGGYVRISVTDNGLGMDETTRSRVFEPFFTTRELGHGTGLGLSTVHGLVKQARGYIRVTSKPGAGSCFEVLLPAHAAAAPEAVVAETAAWSPGSGSVLLVEDQPQVRRSLERILEDAGYEVVAVEDGEQALAIARKKEARFDLLVSDIIMPGISGIELTRRMLVLYPQIAVLLVSGYAGSEITRLGEFGERVHFLPKPFSAVNLTAAAQTALARAQTESRHLRTASLTN